VLSPLEFVRRVVTAAYEDNVFFLASALTFQALLAALPFGLLALAALGHFVHAGEEEAVRIFRDLIPSAGLEETDPFRQVERFLGSVRESRGRLSVFGFPLFLWFSTRFFSGARTALNEIFDTHENRSWWRGVTLDFGLVIAALVLVVSSTAITVQLLDLLWLGRFVSSISTFSLGVLLFFLVYKVSPTRHVRWDTAVVAAAVAAFGFEATKRMYVVYIVEFATLDRLISNNNAIALVLLVVWMYFTACVFLIGAEVAESYDLGRRQSEQRAILT
jgi:YihY family inner membrane protein